MGVVNGQKRAEVWRGADGRWYALATRERPRYMRRGCRISESAWPTDHMEGSGHPYRTHAEALAWAIEQTHDTTGEQA